MRTDALRLRAMLWERHDVTCGHVAELGLHTSNLIPRKWTTYPQEPFVSAFVKNVSVTRHKESHHKLKEKERGQLKARP